MALRAQVVEQDEAALVYYSPKTMISVDLTYTVEVYECGMFAEYAEAMLGAEEAVTEPQTIYDLKSARIGTRSLTDYARPHKVSADVGIPLLLSINEKGVLKGYNIPMGEETKPQRPNKQESDNEQKIPMHLSPFGEDVLEAATPLAQANAVAKQIFRLRETRNYLLNGEVEHAPADGEAMRLVLAELDKQERALTELFVGKKTKRTDHKIVMMNPEKKEKLLFFSKENGFTDAENIDADTVRIQVNLHPQTLKAADDSKKKKKGMELSPIVYNLPGNGDVTVTTKGRTISQRTVPVAQIGVDVPLPKNLFTGNALPVIEFDEKTGNVKSINL